MSRRLTAISLAALCVGLALIPQQLSAAPPDITPAPTATESSPDTTVPLPPAENTPDQQTRATGLLEIESLAFSAKFLTMPAPAAGETLDPPTTTEAFIVTGAGWGTPHNTDAGSIMIAMHSSRSGPPALGDTLLDRSSGTLLLEPLDRIRVDGVAFTITETRIVAKGSLIDEPDIWDSTVDLLIVTCAQYDGRPSDLGLILAQRVTTG